MDQIRLARREDLERIEALFQASRQLMIRSGNPSQWAGAYPAREDAESDIAEGIGYVLEREGLVHAYFMLTASPEPRYAQLSEGAWLKDRPYLVMHRLAGSGEAKGLARPCFDFAKALAREKKVDLRADTHPDNRIMQAAFLRYGLRYCGVIPWPDGSIRLAYQWLWDGTD